MTVRVVPVPSRVVGEARAGRVAALAHAVGRDDVDLHRIGRLLSTDAAGWRDVEVWAAPGLAVATPVPPSRDPEGDAEDPDRSSCLVATHAEALVHTVVGGMGFGWRHRTPPEDVVADREVAARAATAWATSDLGRRLPPTIDPGSVRWWSWQPRVAVTGPADTGGADPGEVTVLDTVMAGMYRQREGVLVPTTAGAVFDDVMASLAPPTGPAVG